MNTLSMTFNITVSNIRAGIACEDAGYDINTLWHEDADVVPANAKYALHEAIKRTFNRWVESDGLYDGPKRSDKSYGRAVDAARKNRKKEK